MPKPKVCLVSSAPREWQALTDITWASHKAYAERHGYDYHADVSSKMDDYQNYVTGKTERIPIRGFIKFELLLYFLKDYEWVVWLDADLLVTNPAIPIEHFTMNVPHGIITGYDFNGTHTTVIMARNHPTVRKFLHACNSIGRRLFLNHPWHEMESFKHFAEQPPYKGLIGYRSAKELCAILADEYVPFGNPLSVSGEYKWAPGDFALHLSALPTEKRVELAREYAEKVKV